MTIPNLITAHQKKVTATKLQKAISTLKQAYRLSFEDAGEPENALKIGAEDYFKTYQAPYLKVATYYANYQACNYPKHQPFTYANKRASDREFTRFGNDRTTFFTPDGFLFIMHIGLNGGALFLNEVVLDINGAKGPNRYGCDVFFLIRENGVIASSGYNKTNEQINNNCSVHGIGDYCAEKIKRAGWQIDKSYPWK